MKKSIIISGVILVNIFVFGALFKVQHWPGANILITIGLGLFSFFFLPLAFIHVYKSNGAQQKALYIAGFICAFIVFTGALFKIMHWPGAAIFLLIGIPLPFLYFLPTYIYFHNKSKDKSILNFVGVMLMMVYVAVYTSLLGINVSKKVIDDLAYVGNNIQISNTILKERNSLIYNALDTDDENINLKTETEKVLTDINSVKSKLVESLDGNDSPSINENIIDYELLFRADETKTTNHILRGYDGMTGEAMFLKNKLTNYFQFLSNLNLSNDEWEIVSQLINTSDVKISYDNAVYDVTWEDRYFPYGLFLIAALNNLNSIESNVNTVHAFLTTLRCKHSAK